MVKALDLNKQKSIFLQATKVAAYLLSCCLYKQILRFKVINNQDETTAKV